VNEASRSGTDALGLEISGDILGRAVAKTREHRTLSSSAQTEVRHKGEEERMRKIMLWGVGIRRGETAFTPDVGDN